MHGGSSPPAYFWERFNITLDPPARGSCNANTSATVVSTSALNDVSDFVVLVLPVLVLSGLHLNTGKKLALISVFLVGLL